MNTRGRAIYFLITSDDDDNTRLLSVYAGEADKLQRLTEIVLSHHSKDSNTWSLQVVIVQTMIGGKTPSFLPGGWGGGHGPTQDRDQRRRYCSSGT